MNTQMFQFRDLPRNLRALEAMPESSLISPFQTAALTIAVMSQNGRNPEDSFEMLNYLRGPRPLTTYDKRLIYRRLHRKAYKPYSYMAGATAENNYTPTQPYQITVFDGPDSYQSRNNVKLLINSSGAPNPREIRLRRDPDSERWYLWEDYLWSDIKKPLAQTMGRLVTQCIGPEN